MKLIAIRRISIPLITAYALAIASCSDPDRIAMQLPSISIERTDAEGETRLHIRFTPDSRTARFVYALGHESHLKDFDSETMSGMQYCEGNSITDITFDGLEEDYIYTVFARAFDAQGRAGDVASMKLRTATRKFTVKLDFISDHAAAFTMSQSGYYCKLKYALDQPCKANLFRSGSLDGHTVELPSELIEYAGGYTATFFDLDAASQYAFYVQAYDRFGGVSEVIELAASTYAEGACPSVNLQLIDIDVYKGRYELVANEHCGRYAVWIDRNQLVQSSIFEEWGARGNALELLDSWVRNSNNSLSISHNGEDIRVETRSPMFTTDEEFAAYVITYDKANKPFAIQRFGTYSAPSYEPAAGEAEVTVTVGEVSSSRAKYSFSPNQHTILYLFETIDADWWDALIDTEEEKYEGLRQILAYEYPLEYLDVLYNGHWMHHRDQPQSWIEDSPDLQAGKRYYAAAFAINVNGEWGKLSLTEYTTAP
ncbi:MAG: hypothetical protein LBC98_07365 [Prevotellaceae bacterium]|jgi:hypothetical protein|nr:hypothetical protein [Prevotellaceae bacterium]